MLRNVERVMSLGAQVRAKELDSLNEEMERSAAQRERSTMAEELTTLRSKVRPIHIYCMKKYDFRNGSLYENLQVRKD
eukprot:8276309-Pyramimonas_sp.AAC.1